MPPVRWKLWLFVMTIFVQVAFMADAQQMQDSISMSSDGWRPIVGTGRQPLPKPKSEIVQYANPNQAFDVVPADILNSEATTQPYNQKYLQKLPVKNGPAFKDRKQGLKIKYSHKTGNQYYVPSGPQQPPIQQFKKIQVVKKPVAPLNKSRKPIRGQALAHSSRNEVFVPPPSPNSGGYSFIKSVSPNNIKTREAQGFGLLGNNFGISQQSAHIELARFPLTGESILQRPTFFLAKPLQNDEFTRNLVPPPRTRTQQKNKDTKISLYAFKEGPATDATSNIQQFGVARPNNQFLPQVSPTFAVASQQQQQKPQTSQQTQEQTIDVQVTRENLKQYNPNGPPLSFATAPGRNSFPIGYVDYNFQKRPPQNTPNPNTLTYEVTEGKWLDTPSQQYQFRPQESFFRFQNVRQPPPNARPGLLFQSEVSTSRPNIFEAPLVDLSVPGFLPTPYKAEGGVIPTSPTQSEAATVFSQVSDKMNRYRNEALQDNPLFFDIKDVSTHYPILGTPEAQSEGGTDTPLPMNENGEISNEITTTQKEQQRTRRPTEPTRPTSTRDPTKSRINNRRRPRPRKPSTTTTTEEPVMETYQPIKSQDLTEEVAIETERPRRRRPKPTVYRTQQSQSEGDREPVQIKKPTEDESLPNKQRGRYRFRTRERPSTERSDTNVIQRKRLRPTYTEEVIKQQETNSFEETTEISVEQDQYSFERDPSLEQVYSQELPQTDETPDSQNQRFETEQPLTKYESSQEQSVRQESKPFIEEIHPVTDRTEAYEKTRTSSATSITEEESNTHFHIPENEVDFTTSRVTEEELREVTTTPQSTTTAEATTTKSTRIRRPSKYDSSNRPRFSVKDYRQRLNQYTSTTPSTTTQLRSTSENVRLRFPSRHRTRPSPTTASSRVDEDVTTTAKSRFRPKDPRHQTTTESDLIITEKSVKAINTRLRPFGRSKTTTEPTTVAPKISIRPNLFSARRRAGYPSLKSRIQNKSKKNETDQEENDIETTTSSQNEIEENEPLNVAESATTEMSTTTDVIQQTSEGVSTESIDDSVTEEIMKNEDFMYSQRVSDLTSSFKDYDKPGVFNSVAPTSRSIPNYFTLSTDDPILPIEAFFPNLKEQDKAKDR